MCRKFILSDVGGKSKEKLQKSRSFAKKAAGGDSGLDLPAANALVPSAGRSLSAPTAGDGRRGTDGGTGDPSPTAGTAGDGGRSMTAPFQLTSAGICGKLMLESY